ncbi:MAG: hypothetical protein QXL14_01900 [Candidatus Aenigmatarchaeota archaeon]
MNVKIFCSSVMGIEDMEKEINDFIKDKNVKKIIAKNVSNLLVVIVLFD